MKSLLRDFERHLKENLDITNYNEKMRHWRKVAKTAPYLAPNW